MGNADSNSFEWVNSWVVVSFKTKVLLAGYWGDYPDLLKAWTVESSLQLILAFSYLVLNLVILYKYRLWRNPYWSVIYQDKHHPLGALIIAPIIICVWEIFLAGMHLGLGYTWFGAPTGSMVYLHSQSELYLTLLRAWILWGTTGRQITDDGITNPKLRISLFSFAIFSLVTLIIFMSTSNPRIQGGVAGTAFLTDFALLILTPIFFWKAIKRLDEKDLLEHECNHAKYLRWQEYFFTALSFSHILQYYPPIFMVLTNGSEPSVHRAGKWLVATSYISLSLFIAFAITAGLAVKKILDTPRGSAPSRIMEDQKLV